MPPTPRSPASFPARPSPADPAAGFLAVTDEIVRRAGRDLLGVIGPAVRGHLGEPHHQRPGPRSRRVCLVARFDLSRSCPLARFTLGANVSRIGVPRDTGDSVREIV
jgi:hypothetical protein